MNRTEALDRDEPLTPTAARAATGTDGVHWWWSYRMKSGEEWTLEICRGARFLYTLEAEREPSAEANWVPGNVEPEGLAVALPSTVVRASGGSRRSALAL